MNTVKENKGVIIAYVILTIIGAFWIIGVNNYNENVKEVSNEHYYVTNS